MGCFCHATLPQLRALLPSLNIAADLSATAALPQAQVALGLSAWLGAHGLPASPWQPDPAWLSLPLPQLRLDARVVATISALAQLRAQVQALFGLDLLVAEQAHAFARIVATMNARLSVLADLQINAGAWLALANLDTAIAQVELALRLGLLLPSPQLTMSLTVPGGIPMARWNGFLALLRALAPMVAATAQLGVSITETAQLSAALRVLAQLRLPALAAPGLMVSLSATFSAIASLQASLGVSPLTLGLPAVQLRVQARLQALLSMLSMLSAQFRVSLSMNMSGGDLLAALLALLPALPVVPTSFATSAVVQVALQAQALASLNWQIAVAPPAIQIGLPTCSFVAQMQAALGLQAVMRAPCPICDAQAVLRA